jgi:tripartite-type tricarboxylate transporter receptor subunit TctC
MLLYRIIACLAALTAGAATALAQWWPTRPMTLIVLFAAGGSSDAIGCVGAALETPSMQQRLKQLGGDLVASERRSPEYLAKFVADEIKKWEAPVKASGVHLD